MARRRPTEPTVNPARGAALVVAAVVIGLLLLRNGLDTSEVVTASKGDKTSDTSKDKTGESGASTSTTQPARSPAQVTVIVLNGTSVSGAAGKFSTAIGSAGYTMLPPGDAATKIPATQIFFTPGFQREAVAVALAAGAPATLTPAALPTPPPGDIGAANVVVVVGTDLANVTPTTAAPSASSTTSTTR